ncbi:MAG: hypothetical protein A4E53_03767 [Pelotomaculum sp. PtaB.Bin104]|nr:MAG: hypothetical protein A4E53_03767 [Pelotomaculum sp. PtaB.Bin104]
MSYDKLWLKYYGTRNLVFLGKRYSTKKFHFYTNAIKIYLKLLAGIVLFDDNKMKRINFFTKALIDGFTQKFDNNKPRKILYKGSSVP